MTSTETASKSPLSEAPPRPRSAVGTLINIAVAVTIAVGGAALIGLAPVALGPARSGDPDLANRAAIAAGSGAGYQALVVAEITPSAIVWAGLGAARDCNAPTADDRFELGSITKTFTGSLLAMAIARREVTPDEPLAKQLPELANSPAGLVTLAELAQHRSGLPRLGPQQQTNAIGAGLLNRNPYGSDEAQLLADAQRIPTSDIDAAKSYAYSNFGPSLLGLALTRAAKSQNYAALVAARITGPLGLSATTFANSRAEVPNAALDGHLPGGARTAPWTDIAYQPAGSATYTSITDLARWGQAQLTGANPGAKALDPTVKISDHDQIGWFWMTSESAGQQLVWHNGRTGGFSSMLAIDRTNQRAVAVLGNSAAGVDPIATQLLFRQPGAASADESGPLFWAPWTLVGAAAVLGLLALRKARRGAPTIPVLGDVLFVTAVLIWLAARGPWDVVGGWVWAVTALPGALAGAVAVRRALTRSAPLLPERRQPLAVVGFGLSALCAVVAVVAANPLGG